MLIANWKGSQPTGHTHVYNRAHPLHIKTHPLYNKTHPQDTLGHTHFKTGPTHFSTVHTSGNICRRLLDFKSNQVGVVSKMEAWQGGHVTMYLLG